jgi:hypothetical protein
VDGSIAATGYDGINRPVDAIAGQAHQVLSVLADKKLNLMTRSFQQRPKLWQKPGAPAFAGARIGDDQ